MQYQEKIEQLRAIIYSTLTPLITGDYLLLDVPYHSNIGDTLIWQGETEFLKSIPHRCLRVSSCSWWGNYLHPETVILFHGGGNFGDLYRKAQDFRLRIISQCHSNRIIIFPQSVWYNDESLIARDAEVMAAHPDLTICARDRWSYDFLCKHFGRNKILLVPDMAFCIADDLLARYRGVAVPDKKLYFRRTDGEYDPRRSVDTIEGADIYDWPTVGDGSINMWFLPRFNAACRRLGKYRLFRYTYKLVDLYVKITSFRQKMVKRGCSFLAPYEHIYTTRLHGLILAVLLHKQVDYLDNTTGKLSAYVDTWLADLDGLNKMER